jgi:hypothetical protein
MLLTVLPAYVCSLFIGWIVHRLFIRRDLKKNMADLLFGIALSVFWAILYWLSLHY